MKVYIAWSGERSKQIGKIFDEMLPFFIHSCETFFSPDIGKGLHWLSEITDELRDSAFGVICLTRENINEPWILFEAGALSKGLEKNHVCPFLLDLKVSDITGPLSQFQLTNNTDDDLLRLIKTINSYSKKSVPENVLITNFEKYLPDFKSKLDSVPSFKEVTGKDTPPPKKLEVVLEEILENVRDIKRERRDYDDILANIGGAIAMSPRRRQKETKIIVKVNPDMGDEIKQQLLRNLLLGISRIETPKDKDDEFNVYFGRKPDSLKITTIGMMKGVESIITEDE